MRAWVRCAGVMNRLVGGAGAGKAIGPMAKATARAAVLKYIQENMTLPSVTNLAYILTNSKAPSKEAWTKRAS